MEIYIACTNNNQLIGDWFEIDFVSSVEDLEDMINKFMEEMQTDTYEILDYDQLPHLGCNPDLEVLYQVICDVEEHHLYVVTAAIEEYGIEYYHDALDHYISTFDYMTDIKEWCLEHLQEMNGYNEPDNYNFFNPYNFIDQELLLKDYKSEVIDIVYLKNYSKYVVFYKW